MIANLLKRHSDVSIRFFAERNNAERSVYSRAIELGVRAGADGQLVEQSDESVIHTLKTRPRPAYTNKVWEVPSRPWVAFLATGVGFLTDRLARQIDQSRLNIVFVDRA